jgi:transcriptional regulator
LIYVYKSAYELLKLLSQGLLLATLGFYTDTMCTASGVGWKAKFAETDVATLHQFIRDHPLGALTTHLPNDDLRMPDGAKVPNLQTTYIPFIFDAPFGEDEKSPGTLRGHMARENPHAKALAHALVSQNSPCPMLKEEVMILFNSPAESYVTPSFYTHTKPNRGTVVPTWFFSAVQVYGRIRLYSDISTPEKVKETSDFLLKQTTDLTRHCEENLMKFEPDKSWKISDAPESFIAKQSERIMGIEIIITRIEGKSKMGQEITLLDQMGCTRGFEAIGTSTSKEIALSIEKSMSKDTAKNRANVLKEEKAKGLKLGEKTLSKYGSYFAAKKPEVEVSNKWNAYTQIFEGFAAGIVVTGLVWGLVI